MHLNLQSLHCAVTASFGMMTYIFECSAILTKRFFKSIELLRCWHSLTHALTREGGKSDSAHKNKGLMMVYQSQAWKLILCPSFAFALTSFIQTDNNPPEYITVIISNQQSLSEHCDSLRFRFNSILIKM